MTKEEKNELNELEMIGEYLLNDAVNLTDAELKILKDLKVVYDLTKKQLFVKKRFGEDKKVVDLLKNVETWTNELKARKEEILRRQPATLYFGSNEVTCIDSKLEMLEYVKEDVLNIISDSTLVDSKFDKVKDNAVDVMATGYRYFPEYFGERLTVIDKETQSKDFVVNEELVNKLYGLFSNDKFMEDIGRIIEISDELDKVSKIRDYYDFVLSHETLFKNNVDKISLINQLKEKKRDLSISLHDLSEDYLFGRKIYLEKEREKIKSNITRLFIAKFSGDLKTLENELVEVNKKINDRYLTMEEIEEIENRILKVYGTSFGDSYSAFYINAPNTLDEHRNICTILSCVNNSTDLDNLFENVTLWKKDYQANVNSLLNKLGEAVNDSSSEANALVSKDIETAKRLLEIKREKRYDISKVIALYVLKMLLMLKKMSVEDINLENIDIESDYIKKLEEAIDSLKSLGESIINSDIDDKKKSLIKIN